MVRLAGYRARVGRRRFLQPVLGLQNDAQIVVRRDVVRLAVERPAVGVGGCFPFALRAEDIAEVVVKDRHPAVLRNGLADQLHGDFIAAGLMGKHTQKMQGIGVARISLQNLPVQTFRFVQAS